VLKVVRFCGPEVPINAGHEAAPIAALANFACEAAPPVKYADEESHFFIGYFGLLSGDYPLCASQLKFNEKASSNWIFQKSHLYLADCQAMLADRFQAAGNLSKVNPGDLNRQDFLVYERLRQVLAEELSRVERVRADLEIHGGPLLFGSNSPRKNGIVIGTRASFFWSGWSVGAGLEHKAIKARSASGNYSQNQFHLDGGRWVRDYLKLKLGFTAIDATPAGINAQAAILGADYIFDESANGSLSLALSRYPKTGVGLINATQLSGDFHKRLIKGLKSALWAKTTLQGIYISQAPIVDTATGYTLRPTHIRLALQVLMKQDPFTIGLGGWLGREAFGVRHEGYVIANSLEDHTQGLDAFFHYSVNQKLSARVSASREITKTLDTPISASAYTAMLNFNF
jgi:hypothetical protein